MISGFLRETLPTGRVAGPQVRLLQLVLLAAPQTTRQDVLMALAVLFDDVLRLLNFCRALVVIEEIALAVRIRAQ